MSFGRQITYSTGNQIMVIAEAAAKIDWKTGGVTMDWNTVPAVTVDTTLNDGNVIKAGTKGVEFGTVFTKITASGLYGPYTGAAPGATTLNGATGIGATQITLASAASIYPGDQLTMDSAGNIETARVQSVTGNVVTLSGPLAIAHANGIAVAKVNDGRATLTPGEVYILNQTQLQTPFPGIAAYPVNHPAMLYGGSVWLARLKVGGTNQPTLAALIAALPRLHMVEMS